MINQFIRFVQKRSQELSLLSKPLQIFICSLLFLLPAALLLWLFDKIFIYFLARSYVDDVAVVFNLNKHLAQAVSLAVFVAGVYLISKIFSLSRSSRLLGTAGLLAILIAHSLLLWQGTKNQFFDRSGKAIKCYVLSRDGDVRYLEREGVDAVTGRPCRDVTPETIERLQEYAKGKRPERVSEDEPVFFDPRTGEPIIWFWRAKSGEIELFNLMGFHPESGEDLQPITRDVVDAFKAQIALHKKEEEERSRRPPQRVDLDNYSPFDPRTGQVRVWYWRGPNGDYEFYDNHGFHPSSGAPLVAVTKEILDEAKKAQLAEQRKKEERKRRPPQQIDPNKFAFFDPASGEPQVWYWRGQNGEYEFYDNQGFHPRTGESLKIINGEAIAVWKRDTEAAESRRRQEQLQREKERREQTERQEREQQEALARQQRQAQAGVMCDQAAANPADPRKPSDTPGVSYDELKGHATEALEICRLAMDTFPDELRYKYQYARALDFSEPDKAIGIYNQLTGKKYPAAFDNLGSLLLRRRNYSGAIAVFKGGAQLGDPDSMVSLVDLIQRGYVHVENPEAAKFALLSRAAQLGHQGAQLAVEQLKVEFQQKQQEREFQQQQQRMMLDMFGRILGGVAH